MKINETIYLPETKRFLVVLHGEYKCSVVDSPFTSMKMDIYHQLRNLRIRAEKVGQQVITIFRDLTGREAAAIQADYEERLFSVEYLNGKEWDKIYKSLLNELTVVKPPKQKMVKKQAVDPIEALEKVENILPGGDEVINDPEEPEIITFPKKAAPAKKATKKAKK